MRLLLIVMATTFVLAGCGDESSDEPANEPAAQEEQARDEQDQLDPPKPKCERASRRLLQAIATGLEVNGGGKLSRGYVVRSKDFSKVFMVAAEIDGPGMEGRGEVGVWATNSKRAEGLIMAVDGLAKEFSDWGDADETDAAIDQSAHGVQEAKDCAEG